MSPHHRRSRRRRRSDSSKIRWQLTRATMGLLALGAASVASGLPVGQARDAHQREREDDLELEGTFRRERVSSRKEEDAGIASGSRSVHDSSKDIFYELAGLRLMEKEPNEEIAEAEHIKSKWEAGRVGTKVDANSTSLGGHRPPLRDTYASLSFSAKDTTSRQKAAGKSRSELLSTKPSGQSPFFCADIGAHGSAHYLNIGLFRPDYPFVPSGRGKHPLHETSSGYSTASRTGKSKAVQGKGTHIEESDDDMIPLSSGPPWSVPPWQSRRNVFKQGWTKSILDDDARLSVPDDLRRPRTETAGKLTRDLLRKKWWRWKPGEGYVLSRQKDFDIYRKGPGIALAQLLPPRERPYTSPLPWIPNQSKRDMAIGIPLVIIFVAIIAIIIEVRAHLRTVAKGKAVADVRRRGSGSLRQPIEPAFFVYVPPNADDATIASVLGRAGTSTSAEPTSPGGSRGLRTRQRTKARNMRDFCKDALDRGVQQVSIKAPTPWKRANGDVNGAKDPKGSCSKGVSKSFIRSRRITSTIAESSDYHSGMTRKSAEQGGKWKQKKTGSEDEGIEGDLLVGVLSKRKENRRHGKEDGRHKIDENDPGNDTFELLEKGGVASMPSFSSLSTEDTNTHALSSTSNATSSNGLGTALDDRLGSPSRLTSISIAPSSS